MAKAVKCPVCEGTGKVAIYAGPTRDIDCHGCEGKGWVEVAEDEWQPLRLEYYPPMLFCEPFYPRTTTRKCGIDWE